MDMNLATTEMAAWDMGDPILELGKAPRKPPLSPEMQKKRKRMLDAVDKIDWTDLPDDIEGDLRDAYVDAAEASAIKLGTSSRDLLSEVNESAREFARERAAEMVGMKRTAKGDLIPNPDAKWNIAETTRTQLRNLITDAFDHHTRMKDLAADIKDAGAFSDSRARMIARTEVARAEHYGNLLSWQHSGVVEQVSWDLSDDHDQDDECLLGDTLIRTGPLRRAFRRFYQGPIVHLYLANGHKLSGSPNHPVLTSCGWKSLQEIHDGEDLVSGDFLERVPSLAHYFDDVETSIQDKFDLFRGAVTARPTASTNFHGDGAGSDVHVVKTKALLPCDFQLLRQHTRQLSFRLGVRAGAVLTRLGMSFASLLRPLFVDLEPCTLGGYGAGFAKSAKFIPVPFQAVDRDTITQALSDLANRELLIKVKAGQFPDVASRIRVLRVEHCIGSGHVYNLTADCGFYLANGIITRNCDDNAEDSPYDIGDVPDHPAHPHCMCALVPILFPDEGSDEDEDEDEEEQAYSPSELSKAVAELQRLVKDTWDESLHPRDEKGRFSSGGGDSVGDSGSDWSSQAGGEDQPEFEQPVRAVSTAPIEEQERALATAEVKDHQPLGGGTNTTEIVTLENGDTAVWKPASGEGSDPEAPASRPRDDIEWGQQTERETAAWQIAKTVGLTDLVAPAVERTINGEKGVMLGWREGQLAYKTGVDRYDGPEDLARATAFDYVIGNTDRHEGNWLVNEQTGKLALIDHGLAFPESTRINGFANQAMVDHAATLSFTYRSNELKGELAGTPKGYAKAYVEHRDQIVSVMRERGLPERSIQGVNFRINRLAAAPSWNKLFTGGAAMTGE